jgi:glycosyltransferase involved in cell wall biosynthesis
MASSLLDDLADNRPLNILVKVIRFFSRLARRGRADSLTVVIVTWNTLHVTRTTVRLVQRFSPNLPIMVVDNCSTDGTREWLRTDKSIGHLLLPMNVGHAIALDIACLLLKTRIMVSLDSDAFPLGPGWLEPVMRALDDPRVVTAGTCSSRAFVHPMYFGIKTDAFRRCRLSFQPHIHAGAEADAIVWGSNAFDTSELLSRRLAENEIVFISATPNRIAGLPGMTAGDVVYHHGGVTRAANGTLAKDGIIAWDHAVTSLVGDIDARDPLADPVDQNTRA